MKITDTVTDCNTNDLRATTPETSTQTSYDGITPKLGYQITEVLKLCKHNNPAKISALTKEACTALGLPLDTKGGKKSPAQNVAIFEWLRDNKTTSAKPIDLPIVEPVAPEIINDDATTVEPIVDIATDLRGIDTQLEPVAPAEAIEPKTTNADLFALEPVTPSNNVARLTESFSNEMAHTPIQIRHVSHLNQSMQVVINDGVITDIKQTHALALEFRQIANKHARRVGELLLQVKAELNHGEFVPWLAENVDVSIRQAQRYMRDAKGLPAQLRTINKNGTVSYLNPPADLITQVETLETETLRLENEKLQRDLLVAQQAADDLAAKVGTAQQQNDDLRGNIDAKVSAVIATERADLVVENSAAMQALEKQLSDAKDKIARDKKDLDKAIADGVRCKMNELDNEIRRKELSSEGLTESIKELRETKSELNEEVGAIQKHNKSVEKIKDYLTSVKGYTWDLLDDSASTPVENLNDWYLIDDALDKLKQDVADIISNGKTLREVIKSQPIDGELV